MLHIKIPTPFKAGVSAFILHAVKLAPNPTANREKKPSNPQLLTSFTVLFFLL